MNELTAIVVDDQEISRVFLESMLSENCKDVKIVGSAYSMETAKQLIESCSPDIMFLDVELPEGNIFEVLNQVDFSRSELVFTTGHDEYAIGAIKISATDYLQKPIQVTDLVNAVDKCRKNKELKKLEEKIDAKIPVTTSGGIINLSVEQIIRCESDHYYTKIFMKTGERHIITKTLKEFEEMLRTYSFVRVHQSHLINIKCLERFEKSKNIALLNNGAEIPVSRRKKEELLKHL